MVHGKCKSAGCYAMTDALIEEIYALAREQFIGGHESFQVHAYPFRMTAEKMAQYRKHRWYPFWVTMKEGYDYFEATRQPPPVAVCERKYLVNVNFTSSARVDAESQCPRYERLKYEPFKPSGREQIAEARTMAPGPKMRSIASVDVPAQSSPERSSPGFTSSTPGMFGKSNAPVGLGFSSQTD
jgi:hypothetical protein